jgi:hypothetical protein
MNVIFPVAPVIRHLEANVPRAKIVGLAGDLRTAQDAPPSVASAAYVVQSTQGDTPDLSTGVDAYAQSAASEITVVLWLRNYAQARTGAAARVDMDAFINEVASALIGFTPSDEYRSLWFKTSNDVFYEAAWLVSQITFQSEFIIGR